MLNAWSELTDNKSARPDTLERILNQPLFNNINMKTKHTPTNPFPPLPKPNTETKKNDNKILADICRVFAQGFPNGGAIKHHRQNSKRNNQQNPNRLEKENKQQYTKLPTPTLQERNTD